MPAPLQWARFHSGRSTIIESIRSSLSDRIGKQKLAALIERIDIERDAITIRFDAAVLTALMETDAASPQPDTITRTITVCLMRTRLAMKLVLPSNKTVGADVDARLVRAIAGAGAGGSS